MSFNWIQTFFLDPSAVKGAQEVGITKVDLYFRGKPPLTSNKSGIYNPGVEVKIVPCINGMPMFDEVGVVRPTEPTEHGAKFAFYSTGAPARKEWNEIIPSTDASIATSFQFKNPYFVKTNQEYGILIKYDGNEDYILWSSKSGDYLLGTKTPSPGPSGPNIGNLFKFASKPDPKIYPPLPPSNTSTGLFNTANTTTTSVDSKYYQSNLLPIKDTDIKFKVYAARYSVSGEPVSSNAQLINNPFVSKSTDVMPPIVVCTFTNNTYTITAQADTLEYVEYDPKYSNIKGVLFGDLMYQTQPWYPGAGSNLNTGGANSVCTVATIANTTLSNIITANGNFIFSNGITFNASGGFNNIFTGTENEFIVISNGNNHVNIRKVTQIISNTQIALDDAVTFTNSAAYFCKSPVAALYSAGQSYAYGKSFHLLTMNDSNANASTRFVNNSVQSVTIVSGGSGYSNTDYITISGYENIAGKVLGGYNATANVITDGSGTITKVMVTNTGAGFVNTAWLAGSNVTFTNSSGGSSAGSSANLTYNIGATIRSELSNETYFGNCTIINQSINRVKPEITVNNPVGTAFNIKLRSQFYETDDNTTVSGKTYYLNNNPSLTDTPIKIFKNQTINTSNVAVLPSRSNEWVIPYANGSLANSSVLGEFYSNSVTLLFETYSNNDFTAPFIDPDITRTHYSQYIINNDYTDEHTNYGNAWSKHIGTKINFAQERLAEDLLVYLTAYRPSGTDIKVYARVHNSKDPEAFDDKDWTLLEETTSVGVYSSKDNSSDYVELTYNFTQYPNTEVTLDGSVTAYQGQPYLIGNGTSFSNSSVYITFNGNTAVSNTNEFISSNAHPFANNDQVTYYVAAGNTAVSGLANNTIYFVVQANTSGFKLSSTKEGSAINLTAGVSETGHSLYRTAVVPDDLIKIYSPLFADNYTIQVVNAVTNSTHLTIKRSLGDLSANLAGTISVNNSTTTFDGVGTAFNTDFASGDFIAVWSNATSYEVRQISSVTDANTIVVDSAFTFTNTASQYSIVTIENFVNNSISVQGNKIDRLEFKHQAFNNYPNENVVRYFNSSMTEFDGYDTFQLKIVLLSDSNNLVPKVDDVRGIGVSA